MLEMLKLDIASRDSVQQLSEMSFVELQCYTPSTLYSLVPGNHPCESHRVEFVSEAAKRLAIVIHTQWKKRCF